MVVFLAVVEFHGQPSWAFSSCVKRLAYVLGHLSTLVLRCAGLVGDSVCGCHLSMAD